MEEYETQKRKDEEFCEFSIPFFPISFFFLLFFLKKAFQLIGIIRECRKEEDKINRNARQAGLGMKAVAVSKGAKFAGTEDTNFVIRGVRNMLVTQRLNTDQLLSLLI